MRSKLVLTGNDPEAGTVKAFATKCGMEATYGAMDIRQFRVMPGTSTIVRIMGGTLADQQAAVAEGHGDAEKAAIQNMVFKSQEELKKEILRQVPTKILLVYVGSRPVKLPTEVMKHLMNTGTVRFHPSCLDSTRVLTPYNLESPDTAVEMLGYYLEKDLLHQNITLCCLPSSDVDAASSKEALLNIRNAFNGTQHFPHFQEQEWTVNLMEGTNYSKEDAEPFYFSVTPESVDMVPKGLMLNQAHQDRSEIMATTSAVKSTKKDKVGDRHEDDSSDDESSKKKGSLQFQAQMDAFGSSTKTICLSSFQKVLADGDVVDQPMLMKHLAEESVTGAASFDDFSPTKKKEFIEMIEEFRYVNRDSLDRVSREVMKANTSYRLDELNARRKVQIFASARMLASFETALYKYLDNPHIGSFNSHFKVTAGKMELLKGEPTQAKHKVDLEYNEKVAKEEKEQAKDTSPNPRVPGVSGGGSTRNYATHFTGGKRTDREDVPSDLQVPQFPPHSEENKASDLTESFPDEQQLRLKYEKLVLAKENRTPCYMYFPKEYQQIARLVPCVYCKSDKGLKKEDYMHEGGPFRCPFYREHGTSGQRYNEQRSFLFWLKIDPTTTKEYK